MTKSLSTIAYWTAFGLAKGGILSTTISSAIGLNTIETLNEAPKILGIKDFGKDGNCTTTITLPAEQACDFSEFVQKIVSDSSTLRIAIVAVGTLAGGGMGLLYGMSEAAKQSTQGLFSGSSRSAAAQATTYGSIQEEERPRQVM